MNSLEKSVEKSGENPAVEEAAEEIHRRPSSYELQLKMAVEKITENYERRDIPDTRLAKAMETTATISGRSALIFQYVVSDYINRLTREDSELRHRIDSRDNVNVEEAGRTIHNNENLIRVIRGNCLNSLSGVTEKILFPDENK